MCIDPGDARVKLRADDEYRLLGQDRVIPTTYSQTRESVTAKCSGFWHSDDHIFLATIQTTGRQRISNPDDISFHFIPNGVPCPHFFLFFLTFI